jgi:hypothetical protein
VQPEHPHPGTMSRARYFLLARTELRSRQVDRKGAPCAVLLHQSREGDIPQPRAGGNRIGPKE